MNNRRIKLELKYLDPLQNLKYISSYKVKLKPIYIKMIEFSKKYIAGIVGNEKYIEIAIFINDKVYMIKAKIPEYYPFKSPIIEINDKSYLLHLKNLNIYLINNEKIIKYLKIQFNKYDCLCCRSILCDNKWNPSFTTGLYSILNEINKNLIYENKIKKTIRKYYLNQSKKIIIKYLGFEFIYFYKFF